MKRFEKYRKAIQQDFPDFMIYTIEKTGEGDNSKAFVVNKKYIFRFPKREEVKEQLRREIAVLPKIRSCVNIAIPEFEFISPAINYVGYKKIKGEVLSNKLFHSLKAREQENIQKTLADFLSAIHSMDLPGLKNSHLEIMDLNEEYQDNFAKAQQLIYPYLSKSKCELISGFFNQYLHNEDNFNYTESLIHNDFSKDHILFNTVNKQISGIIDFGDIAIGDRDYDLMYLLDEFGEKFLEGLLKHYRPRPFENLLQKLYFFSLANKIQLFPEDEDEVGSDEWKYAFKALDKWFKKYNSI